VLCLSNGLSPGEWCNSYLSEEEFRRLHSTERGGVYADVQVDATDLSLDALTARIADLWA